MGYICYFDLLQRYFDHFYKWSSHCSECITPTFHRYRMFLLSLAHYHKTTVMSVMSLATMFVSVLVIGFLHKFVVVLHCQKSRQFPFMDKCSSWLKKHHWKASLDWFPLLIPTVCFNMELKWNRNGKQDLILLFFSFLSGMSIYFFQKHDRSTPSPVRFFSDLCSCCVL